MLAELAFVAHLIVVASLALLSIWGAQRAVTLVDAIRPRRRPYASSLASDADVAHAFVTVQVPLYNEAAVCERAVDAACSLAWSALEVQILDDSDDDTVALVATAVDRWRARGVDVRHIRRSDRRGYKAGALAHGLELARGEFLAVLDADFAPAPDFLARAMTSFAPGIDMVQARWSHHNRSASWLTRAQAALLDAHFHVEQRGRARAGRFFGMNGTAGIWRKSAVVRAGGWDARTLTEDLDLSLRAWLAGSRFAYRDDVEVPAELPRNAAAWRVQQHRWAKGAVQTARARLADVWRARISLVDKLDITLKLTQNLSFATLFAVVALLPIVLAATGHSFALVGVIGTVPALLSLAIARKNALDVILAVGLCAALSPFAAAAAIAGALNIGDQRFHRTPKEGMRAIVTTSDSGRALGLVAAALALIHAIAAAALASRGRPEVLLWLSTITLAIIAVPLCGRGRRRARAL